MTTSSELKPCPFCGSDDVRVHGPYGWYHQWCISHSCRTFYSGAQDIAQDFSSKAEAIAAWNHRTASRPSPTEAMVERVARAICEADGKNPDADWRQSGDVFLTVCVEHPETWRLYEKQARAALKSMEQSDD